MASKILIADDDPDLRTIVHDFLETYGFEIVLAVNGQEALALAAQERPDIILLDMSMPILNGWEVARRLRQDPMLRSTPILAFTAHALKGDKEKTLEAGCDGYVSKPFSPDNLLAEINRLLAERSLRHMPPAANG